MISKEWMCVIAASCTVFAQGAAYTWLTPLLHNFQSPGSDLYLTPLETTWFTALVDLMNALFSIPVAYLADMIGRKPLICSVGPILSVSWLFILFFPYKPVMFSMRAIQGIAMAIQYSVLPIYLSEIASVDIRGGAVCFTSTLWYLGFIYVYLAALFFEFEGITWFAFAPSVVVTISLLWCPESPYWYLLKNRKKEAFNALVKIRSCDPTDGKIIDEIEKMEDCVQKDKELSKGIVKNILFSRKDRKSFLIVEATTIIYMMVGTNTIPINASDTVSILSGSTSFASNLTLILGVILALMTIPSIILSDRWGRRHLLVLSSALTFVVFLAASVSLYCIQIQNIKSETLVLFSYLCILLGTAFTSFGVSSLQPVLVGEMFPTNARSVTAGITYTLFPAASAVSLSLYSFLSAQAGIYANFFVFSAFSAAGFLFFLFFLPETKGKTFAEIQSSL